MGDSGDIALCDKISNCMFLLIESYDPGILHAETCLSNEFCRAS